MVDYSNIPRDSRRVPLETRVQFKFDRFSGFLSEYSANISPGGFFLRTRAPLEAGTVMDFEFRLGDGFELIRGRGEVVWSRTEDEGPTRPAGMGIRFLELSPGSKELIYRIVDQHILQGGTPFDVTQRPPDPSPALPPLAQAFAASLHPPAPAPAPPSPPAPAPWPASPAPPAPAPPALSVPPDIFDLPPAAPARPAEPLPDAASWLPSLEESLPDPLPLPPPRPRPSREEPFPDLLPLPAAAALEAPVPEAHPAPPMFGSTFGSASAAKPRRRVLPLALLAAVLAVVAALYLLREPLLEMAGLGGDDEVVAQAAPRPRRAPRPEATPPPAQDPAPGSTLPGEGLTSDATLAAEMGSETPAPPPALAPTPAPTPQAPPAKAPTPAPPARGKAEPFPAVAEETQEPAESGAALTRLQRITFEPAAGGTDIVLWGDGAIRSDVFTRSRIEGNPPRELIRLSGIRHPFSPARVSVGTSEVLQVRVGYHPETGRGELHVVLDLARPNVVVTGVEPGDKRLRIHLQRK